jgi:hypothetical protein
MVTLEGSRLPPCIGPLCETIKLATVNFSITLTKYSTASAVCLQPVYRPPLISRSLGHCKVSPLFIVESGALPTRPSVLSVALNGTRTPVDSDQAQWQLQSLSPLLHSPHPFLNSQLLPFHPMLPMRLITVS